MTRDIPRQAPPRLPQDQGSQDRSRATEAGAAAVTASFEEDAKTQNKPASSLRMIFKNDSWVRPFLKQYRKASFASLLLGIAVLIFASGLMYVSGYLISFAAQMPARGVWALFVPLAFVQIFGVGKPFLGYFQRLTSHDWVLHITSRLRRRLFRSIDSNGMFWTATHRAGEALGLLSEDIGHLQDLYLRSIFPQVIGCVIWLLMSLLLGLFSWQLGLLTLVIIGLLVFAVPLAAVTIQGARQARRAQIDAQRYVQAGDAIGGIADWTFSLRKKDFSAQVMDGYGAHRAVEAKLAAARRRRSLLIQVIFGAFTVVVLVWAALHFVSMPPVTQGLSESQPPDWIAAFVLGLFPLLEAFAPLPDATLQAQTHKASLERLNALDEPVWPDTENDSDGPQEKAHLKDGISEPLALRFEHVTFAYPMSQEPVLKDINLAIAPGEKVAILGPSGAGKSTLLWLLRGDLKPTEGSVSMGTTPCSELGDAMALHMGVIQQNTYLFNQTLFDNLRMGNPHITQQQAQHALEQVGLGSLLEQLPQGLNTMVDEAGLRFSGGEGHRIALARVLLQDTPIVLLDEPMASLDPLTESALMDTIFNVFAQKTVIMVTHHLLGVGRMDRVVFVEEGSIAMQGTPQELEETSERFRALLDFDRG